MKRRRLEVIRAQEAEHFWFTARRRIVLAACADSSVASDPTVLDVGCGTGVFVGSVAGHGTAIGVDLHSPHQLEAAPGVQYLRGSAEQVPIRGESVDLVLALDVLEHVDDARCLREIRRVLRPGGVVVATVPAHQALWSFRDDDAGHLRRYSRPALRAALAASAFDVERCSFFHGALLPALAVARVIGRRRPHVRNLEDNPPGALNRILSRVTAAEAGLAERNVRPPIGSSLLAVARRPS